jgi:hypothetical protein
MYFHHPPPQCAKPEQKAQSQAEPGLLSTNSSISP